MTVPASAISPFPKTAAPAKAHGLWITVRRHALVWLVLANAVGVWMAVLLVWPDAGRPLGAFTYGRWAPLHLNWQLYGWCALPLVGALLRYYGAPPSASPRLAAGALALWSGALLAGGMSWLGGISSGKLFLDWHGWARPLLPAGMGCLWLVLTWTTVHNWHRSAKAVRRLRAGLLLPLAMTPILIYWASDRGIYPAVNPHSGGATGASLLASTLGVIGIFALLPTLLTVPCKAGARSPTLYWLIWFGGWTVYAAMGAGHASHHAWSQIIGLAVLLVWIPLLPAWLRRYSWSEAARPWLAAATAWWAALVASGWYAFLPGISERLKFTNALVAHAHLAMAGLITSVNFVILNELDRERPLRHGFVWWQAGCATHVAVLAVTGWYESDHATAFFSGAPWVDAVYFIRLAAGLAMLVGSLLAFREGGAA